MDYIKLGTTGLDVSPIAIGAMTYGEPGKGHPVWSKGEDEARPLIKHALDAGINFFDTANLYSLGSSEEILGRAIKDYADRDAVVIATKLRHPMCLGPNSSGLSRKAIMQKVDHSLQRLGTDYIDLYQIHRNDHTTSWEETLEALHDLVKAGKVRYLGASSMHAWEFAKALHLQKLNGWSRFVSMQNHYNLLAREEEREMIPLALDNPWSGRHWPADALHVRGRMRAHRPVRQPMAPTPTCCIRPTRKRPTTPSSTRSARSPSPAMYRGPRSRWPGCAASRSSRLRWSAPGPSRRSMTRWHRWNCS